MNKISNYIIVRLIKFYTKNDAMILESILSCSYLFLTCGSCIYTLIRHSYVQYSKFLSHFVCACCGIATISTRSFIVFMYKLFLREYIFDPIIIQMEEERNKERCNVLYELLGTLSMASLIYSLYCHHGYCIIGVFVATSISIFDVFKLYEMSIPKPKEIKPPQFPYIPSRLKFTAEPRCTMFIWVLVSVCFAYSVDNNFALAANYPYLLTNWVFTPEGFYEGWTVRSTINDYMMAVYVICITEAFKF